MTSPERIDVPNELLLADEWEYLEASLTRFDNAASGAVYMHEGPDDSYGLIVGEKQLEDGSTYPTLNVYQFRHAGGDVELYHIDMEHRTIEVYSLPYEKLMRSGTAESIVEEVEFQRIIEGEMPSESKIAELKGMIRQLRDQDEQLRQLFGDS